MDNRGLVEWLIENAGPSIRYRVLTNIVNEQDVGVVGRALAEVVSSPLVIEWLNRLTPNFDFSSLHHSKETAYENVMGKLVMLGYRAGLQPFDNRTLPFRAWLTDSYKEDFDEEFLIEKRNLISTFLSYAGYGDIASVKQNIVERLETIFTFAKDPDFNSVYVDKSDYTGIPQGLTGSLVNPELWIDGNFMLPGLHDVRAFAFSKSLLKDSGYRRVSERVIKLVLSKEYQGLEFGFGIGKFGKRYYPIGWSAHLPGYSSELSNRQFPELLLNMEMMAPFEATRRSDWFKRSMNYLDSYKTEDGTYLFLRKLLPEKRIGYWVAGNRMALEHNRKSSLAIECESTFWIVWIKYLAGML